MPKFEKGSQEAKDYMASLRAKRMSGGKMPQPPRDTIDTGKDPKPENWEQPPRRPPVAIRPPVRIRPPPIRRITNTDAPNPFEGNGLMSDIVGTVKQTAKKTRKIINKTAQSVKTVAQGGRDDYPPSVRKLLKTNGEKKIVSAIINRKPVEKKLSGLLNVLSLGQFKKNIENEPYDDLFHLSIVLRTEDGKDILVEKNEVINMAMKGRKGGENLPITPFQGGKTLNEIMENTKKLMGEKFFGYSARNNNCQDFIMALLKSNGMGDANDFTFVKQDAKQMFKGLSTLSKVADFITDLGGATNVLIKGTGVRSSKIAVSEGENLSDREKLEKRLEYLQEQEAELLIALYDLGFPTISTQDKYDKIERSLYMVREKIEKYEKAIARMMSGTGASASVPIAPVVDEVDEDYTENEMYVGNEKMADNIERALIEELMNTFSMPLIKVKKNLKVMEGIERQYGLEDRMEAFLVEQMERDIDWNEYKNNKTLSNNRPAFKGGYYDSIIRFFQNPPF